MLSLEGRESQTQITVFDKQGKLANSVELIQAMLRVRMETTDTHVRLVNAFSDDVSNRSPSPFITPPNLDYPSLTLSSYLH